METEMQQRGAQKWRFEAYSRGGDYDGLRARFRGGRVRFSRVGANLFLFLVLVAQFGNGGRCARLLALARRLVDRAARPLALERSALFFAPAAPLFSAAPYRPPPPRPRRSASSRPPRLAYAARRARTADSR